MCILLGLLYDALSVVRPRHVLKSIRIFDRLAVGVALQAVFIIHGCAVLWAPAVLL